MSHDQYNDMLSEDELITLAENIQPVGMSVSQKSRIWASISQKISTECPDGGFTIPADEGVWFDYDKFIKVKVLHRDEKQGMQTALWRLEPGAVIKCHKHTVDEECLVLEGQILVGGHSLSSGDFHFMHAGSDHPDVTTENGALLFLKHQYTAGAEQAHA